MVPDNSILHIYLLGDLRISRNDEFVPPISSLRAQSLLAYLVLHAGVPQSRRHLAFLLWPDSSDAQSRSNLRKLLHDLRRSLPDVDRFLLADGPSLTWRTDAPFALDVAAFEHQVLHAASVPALEAALQLYQGPLFQSCYDDWVLPERERLQQRFGEGLHRLVDLLEAQGDYRPAIRYAQRWLHEDPLHEHIYRTLMRLYALTDDRPAALRTYHACVAVLRQELDVDPSPATQLAYERLLALKAPPPAPAPTTPPLIGHQREWAALQAVWRQVLHGGPQWVLLTGAPGIGKTRLAEELLAWAAKQGLATARARGYAAEAGLGFGPLTAWLRTRPLPPDLDPVWLAELARVLPELLVAHPDLTPPGPLTEPWQRLRFYEALARTLLAAQPLVLVLDDVQYCDRDTLEWLHFVLRSNPQAQLLLVSTVCLEEVPPEHALQALLRPFRRSGQLTELAVWPLSPAETGELAAQVAGQAVAPQVVEALYAETEGNPLFVVEMVRGGWLDGLGTGQRTALPRTMQAVIASRLGQLSPAGQALVKVAAVIGREFPVEILRQASGVSEEGLAHGLSELRQKRIVRRPEGAGYDFDHSQLREVAYAQLNVAERQFLHRRVAEALLAGGAGGGGTGRSGEIVRHLEAAGLEEQAVPYQVQAGDEARRRYANQTAIDYYRRAIQHLEEPDKTRVLLKLGQVLEFVGQWREAESLYRQSVESSECLKDTHLRGHCELTLAILLHRQGDDAESLKWSRCAKYDFEAVGDIEGIGNVLENMGLVYDMQGDYPRALECHQQHLITAFQQGNRYEMSQSIGNIGLIYWRQANYERALNLYDRQFKIAQELNDRLGMSRALARKGLVYYERGEYAQALEYFEKRTELSNAIGDALGASYAMGHIGMVYYRQGNYAQALAHFTQQLAAAQIFGARRGISQGIRNIGLVYYQHGNFAQACQAILQSLRIALEVGDRRIVAYALGNLAELSNAEAHYHVADRLCGQAHRILDELNLPYALCDLLYHNAHMLYYRGDATHAQPLLNKALRIAGEIGRKEIQFKGKILSILLRAAAAPSSKSSGLEKLGAMLEQTKDEKEQAELYYALWRLDHDQSDWRKMAAKLYRKLHARTPKHTYRLRYEELTGTHLTPPALAQAPDIELNEQLNLDALSSRADEMIKELVLHKNVN